MSSHQYIPSMSSICRIITVDIWNQVRTEQENIPLNDLDKKDGFVHLSTVDQVLETLNRYFVVEQKPLILILDRERLEKKLRWEIVPHRDHKSFPHLYRQIHFDDIKGIWRVDFQETFCLTKTLLFLQLVETSLSYKPEIGEERKK